MNILVLELKRIGDLILTLPALSALKAAFPEARLTLCLLEGCQGLLPGIPTVDEALIYRRHSFNTELLTRLAKGKYDVCLDFTGNDRAAFFALLSRAGRRITFQHTRRYPHRAWAYNEFVDSSVVDCHTVDHHLNLLAPLGIRYDAATPPPIELTPPPETERQAGERLAELGIEGPFAVVHPGTARAEKYWEPGNWAAVIDHCQGELGLPCVITGSNDTFEQTHLAAIRGRMHTAPHDLSGKIDLLGLCAIIRRSSLLLSMDSAPVHIGAAFGTPQIALFGQTNPYVWRPRHPRAIILYPGNPGPVTHFTPKTPIHPLSELPVETVLRAIDLLYPGTTH
ncbi:MAG: glycosyltransferase family 9 protein [Chthoniobacteraceae bacterium]